MSVTMTPFSSRQVSLNALIQEGLAALLKADEEARLYEALSLLGEDAEAVLLGGADETEAIAKANVYAALSTLSVGTQSSFLDREKFECLYASKK